MDATRQCAIVPNLENSAKRPEVQQYRDLKQMAGLKVPCWKNPFWFSDDWILEPFVTDSF